MDIVALLAIVAAICVVVALVGAPLRGAAAARARDDAADEIAELEARKEAKYREIRDAELDRAQGKLSEEDFRRQDAELRAEAIAILKELDRVQGKAPQRAKEPG